MNSNIREGIQDSEVRAMSRALELAEQAATWGDVPVGAVVLDPEGTMIGEGSNRREVDGDPTAHAEMLALRQAGQAQETWRLLDCTLVVTLEPCAMCAGASVLARLGRMVFGAYDDKAGASGSLWDIPRDPRLNHRIEVVSGLMAAESQSMLTEFFRTQRS